MSVRQTDVCNLCLENDRVIVCIKICVIYDFRKVTDAHKDRPFYRCDIASKANSQTTPTLTAADFPLVSADLTTGLGEFTAIASFLTTSRGEGFVSTETRSGTGAGVEGLTMTGIGEADRTPNGFVDLFSSGRAKNENDFWFKIC